MDPTKSIKISFKNLILTEISFKTKFKSLTETLSTFSKGHNVYMVQNNTEKILLKKLDT